MELQLLILGIGLLVFIGVGFFLFRIVLKNFSKIDFPILALLVPVLLGEYIVLLGSAYEPATGLFRLCSLSTICTEVPLLIALVGYLNNLFLFNVVTLGIPTLVLIYILNKILKYLRALN